MHTAVIAVRTTTVLFLGAALPVFAQVSTGELRLRVTDSSGLGLKASVTVSGDANQYLNTFTTGDAGELDIRPLAFGIYDVRVAKPGFAPAVESIEVRSALPSGRTIHLAIAPATSSVQVSGSAPLIDPDRPTSIMQIGAQQIQNRVEYLPGRSVQDLVNSQPGWLYEGNAVLHPRGSEYQTQFVIDGIPLTDNRSPSFGPELEADDLDSISIYTAGIPAEYGRKMGGVVELNTRRESNGGLHGQVVLSGGSYHTGSSYAQLQDIWGRNTLGASASGSMSAHYLNPVVPENYTNRGTTADFSLNYERDFTRNDRMSVSVRHELSRFEIPNEVVQEEAGQLQTGDNFETVGTARYQHIFSPNGLGTLDGMVRDNANDLFSNQSSTPIVAFQHNGFREGYFKGAYSLHHGNQEFKVGVESDTIFLHENFYYFITDPTQFDPGTPTSPPPFFASDIDIEPSVFVEDLIRLGKWTVSAGLRWDHYQLLVNRSGFSPRVSVGRSLPSLNMVLHASLDRVFETPSFENILITSSQWINQIDPSVLHLPVEPSKGAYYEGGMTQAFRNRMSVDLNVYRRDIRDYADDDQLLNTGVSYPIAFDKSVIYGAEGKLSLVKLGNLSGFASFSYMVGNAWLPVTGGLFLGEDAAAALAQTSGHFPDSQDQRNTLRTRLRYQLLPRVWIAAGAEYGSGLPFAYTGNESDALAEYGPQVIGRINFARGRILPSFSANASLGADFHKGERFTTRFQIDGDNLNNRLNLIDFGGLFSGNAVAPGRSVSLRLSTSF
jgi:TonB-dependent Receptor Plug Domain